MRFVAVLLSTVLWLTPLSSVAQTRVFVPSRAALGVPLSVPSLTDSSLPTPTLNAVLPTASLAAPSLSAPSITAAPVAIQAVAVKPAAVLSALRPILPAAAAAHPTTPLTRSEKAAVLVQDTVASWGETRKAEDVAASFSEGPSALTPALSAASAPDAPNVPAPQSPAPKGRPALARVLTAAGIGLVALSLAAGNLPILLPAAVIAAKGGVAWAGLAALAASRFWREPGAAPDVPRGPPAKEGGSFSSFKAMWAAARDSAAAQKSFETRVGGGSWANFRDWLFGGLRTGLYWMGPALILMLGGAAVAKGGMALFGMKAAAAAAPAVGDAAIAVMPLAKFMGGIVPMALAAQAAGVAVAFGAQKIAAKLGAGKAAPWIGAAAGLGVAAFGVLSLTASPFVVVATLGLEAGVLWSALRSNSFMAPLALRGILTIFSLEAARLGAWLKFGAAGALVGLPAVWGGVAVGALALIAWKLKAPGLRLSEIGAAWKTEEPGQRPKSPARILSAGLVWGLVVYAVGDLSFWAVNAIAPGAEPAPSILAKMLTAGVDLVLYNFILVGLLEEFIFRRGVFKWMNDKLDKWKWNPKKAFWTAAIASGIFFSGVHYIDWGAVLAHFGMGDAAGSSGLGGAYAFTWAGFAARAFLGVLLAGIYKRSGLLLIPIVAHFWADSMEGLGLRWGIGPFIALAAGALAVSWLLGRRSKPKSS